MMKPTTEVLDEVHALVDAQRVRCLWFLRPDFYPRTTEEALRVLGYLERYGDRDTFQKAATLKRWLSRPSNAQSAAS